MRTWLLLNSVGLVAVSAVLYLMVRQLGFILQRVGAVGARGTSDGPRIGENLTHFLPEMFSIDKLHAKAKLIIFGSEACSICAVIKKAAQDLAKSWSGDADILLIYDCEQNTDATSLKEITKGVFFGTNCNLRKNLGATFVPFAIVTDRNGTVVGKGLVNEIGHLESLLELEKSESQKLKSVIIEREAEA